MMNMKNLDPDYTDIDRINVIGRANAWSLSEPLYPTPNSTEVVQMRSGEGGKRSKPWFLWTTTDEELTDQGLPIMFTSHLSKTLYVGSQMKFYQYEMVTPRHSWTNLMSALQNLSKLDSRGLANRAETQERHRLTDDLWDGYRHKIEHVWLGPKRSVIRPAIEGTW